MPTEHSTLQPTITSDDADMRTAAWAARKRLVVFGDTTVPVTVQARTPLTPGVALSTLAPIDLSLAFTGWGPFPAVRGNRDEVGPWDTPGSSRRPQLSDGTEANELLTEYDVPGSFAYEVTGFTNVLSRLVEGVRGEWTFTPDGPGTVIRWTYEFKPLRGRASLVRFGLAPLWRRYMVQSLRQTIVAVEAEAARVDESATPVPFAKMAGMPVA